MKHLTPFEISKNAQFADYYIKKQAKRNNNIIYGAQSIKAQIGIYGRNTMDYDIYSNAPRTNAIELKNTLNKVNKNNLYYTKNAKHKGTVKVYYIGQDGKKYTADDIAVADYTKNPKNVKYIVINGVKYSKLSNSMRDKLRSLGEKESKFRHEKDRNDISRIQSYNFLWRQNKW